MAVDIPVGLPGAGGRTADRDGRGLLKPKRISCVFPAPALCILNMEDYDRAKRLSYQATRTRPTRQAHALLRKTRNVRNAVNPNNFYRPGCSIDSAPTWAVEIHPEVSFTKLAGGADTGLETRTCRSRETVGCATDSIPKHRRSHDCNRGWLASPGTR